jgi:imidazolonepropionase-like amidohydrolase
MSHERIVLENAMILDVVNGRTRPKQRVVVEGNTIERVEPWQPGGREDEEGTVVDVQGKTVMPGLCDAHVHVTVWTANLSTQMRSSGAYTTVRAVEILEGMLMRGFTTVRDAGGADYGLAAAVNEGHIRGPRILYCGHALSQTGGHGDMRGAGEQVLEGINYNGMLGLVCDGVAEVRRACRDEIRRGAHHIKLMLAGGVATPDPHTNDQFSEEEIRAAVEEAEIANLYCMGHAYTARTINRALRLGVRSLEHCNLMDETNVEPFLQTGAFMVPTLSVYDSLVKKGPEAGFPTELLNNLTGFLDAGLIALTLAHEGGVKLVYGTDLLGKMHEDQLNEFALRAQVQEPADVIRSATCMAAELFNEVGKTGLIAEGARADLLVVDGNPLEDLSTLQQPDRYLKAIMKDGIFYKNEM